MPLQMLAVGLIHRHARSVNIDVYANAFQVDDLHGQGPHADDETNRLAYAGSSVSAMTPAIFERKFEIDSLGAVLRFSAGYYNATSDLTPFDTEWLQAVGTILDTLVLFQRSTEVEDDEGGPPYTFGRMTDESSDTLEHGRGHPAGPGGGGMVRSCFRNSDDAQLFPYNVRATLCARARVGDGERSRAAA